KREKDTGKILPCSSLLIAPSSAVRVAKRKSTCLQKATRPSKQARNPKKIPLPIANSQRGHQPVAAFLFLVLRIHVNFNVDHSRQRQAWLGACFSKWRRLRFVL